MNDDENPADSGDVKASRKVRSFVGLAAAQDFLHARGLADLPSNNDLLSAAALLPEMPVIEGGYIPEQVVNAQIWLAYYLVSKNQIGMINANQNLKLIGYKQVDLE